ncbi:MAG: ABC transporter ATP-binding protein [Lachnospiraceae bacterium]|nr:ABC transporter ATP-binding protein [Lachnospiraceae bacterium]
MLEFKNVSFQYEGEDFDIIDDLSFTVDKGDFVSIIGISGCGKSTIFKLIGGMLRRKSGQILIEGSDVSSLKTPAGYMPQKDLLFPWRTIEKNLRLPMEIARIPEAEQKARVASILKEVGLSDYAGKYPKDLSGGMRQRISFARTLLTDADLLMLDEPFSALDALTRMNMQEWLLSQWQHLNKTILFITHDVEEALFMSGKIYLVQQTPIHELEVIHIPMDYPRTRDFMARPDIIELKEYMIDQLKRQVIL